MTSPSLLYPSASPSTATLQGGSCFGRLAEHFPLTGYEDTTDVVRLTSPLLSQEREVSAIAFSVFSSQAHSSVERPVRDMDPFSSVGKPVRDVEPLSSFERPLLKGKRTRDLESVQLSQMEMERILSEQKSLHEYLEKEAERAFQG